MANPSTMRICEGNGVKRKSAVFILTHGRADNVVTYRTLERCGYSGAVYIVIDDLDSQRDQYIERFGDKVIIFDKKAVEAEVDTMDNFGQLNVVLFARCVCHKLAKDLGLTHFLQLDDDYTTFMFRDVVDGKLVGHETRDINGVFEAFYDFLDESNAITVTMAQGGDFIGGAKSGTFQKGIARKAMNSFFCRTDREFAFRGRINEDVNTYTQLGSRGDLLFMITKIMLTQGTTQQNEGGMTSTYMDVGTYVKSFYSVIGMPSAVTVQPMGDKHVRLHHRVAWDSCIPKILPESVRKSE